MGTNFGYGQCISIINGSGGGGGFQYRYHDNPVGHWYVSAAIDLNNAFDVNETLYEPQGLDYDIEVGVRSRSFVYYIFYGGYKAERENFKVDFNNYGVGVDYFLVDDDKIKLAIGMNGGAWVKNSTAPTGDKKDVTYLAYAARIKPIYKINKSVGLFLIVQYQQRPDRTIDGIFDVMGGLQLYIN